MQADTCLYYRMVFNMYENLSHVKLEVQLELNLVYRYNMVTFIIFVKLKVTY